MEWSGVWRRLDFLLWTFVLTSLSGTALAGGYDAALKGVTSYDVVYEVTQGDPEIANVVFWAVRDAYENDDVAGLPKRVSVVFHGPAVRLISTDTSSFTGDKLAAVQKFQETLRQMKEGGARLEVCLYAVKVSGMSRDSIMPEVDGVKNGFVSVIGYQKQGYALVQVP